MKKTLHFSLLLGCIFVSILHVNAQQTTSNSRFPKSGDFNFGLNAVPILKWIGNTLNANTDNNAIEEDKFVYPDPSLLLRYAKTENLFYRLTLLGGRDQRNQENLIWDNTQPNNPLATVSDNKKSLNNFWGVGFGLEKRRTNGNLQGYFGAELFYTRDNNKSVYSYGNAFNINNQTPTTTVDFDNRTFQNVGERVLKTSTGSQNTVALRTFLGSEYFFTTGISLGVEFGWFFAQNFQAQGQTTSEYFDSNSKSVQTITRKTGGKSEYSDGFDNLEGAILLNFYF